MTTIAWDGTTLASDSRCSSETRSISVRKIRELADGSLVGFAGTTTNMKRVVEWLDAGSDPELKPKLRGDTEVLVIRPDGTAIEYDKTLEPIEMKDVVAAIGSGGEYAIGAMEAGLSAVQAVEIACRRDPSSQGPIDELQLRKRRR